MIIRNAPNRDFSTIRNAPLEAQNLSLKAKGLWAFLMTKPDKWQISIRGLAAQLPEGKEAIAAALRELEAAGLYRKSRQQTEDGRIEWESVLYDQPRPENPDMDDVGITTEGSEKISSLENTNSPDPEKPYTGNPDTENPPQVNTNKVNTEQVNTDKDLLSDPSDPTAEEGEIVQKESKPPKHPIGDEDKRLANMVRDQSLQNYPHLKLKEPGDLEFRDIERLHRIDGLTYDQIEYMIKWVANDSFWRQNVQSTSKLREQKDKIIIRIKENAQKRQLQTAEV